MRADIAPGDEADDLDDKTGFLKIEFAGRGFYLNAADGADQVAASMQGGSYEAPLPMLLSAAVARTSGLMLDVGANNGLYSVIAAVTRPDARVIAFEPFPPAIEVLRKNIEVNGLSPQIELIECALSDCEGSAPMFVPDPRHGLLETSSSLERGFSSSAQEGLHVQTRLLDAVPLGKPVSVIKADIEGHEAAFLRGAKQTISRDRPIIFAEMLSIAESTFYGVSKMMHELDYMCFRLRTDTAILEDFIRYDPLAWNWALIPKDKMALFRDICLAHRVDLTRPL